MILMANELADCFYPIDLATDDAVPYPIVRHNNKSFVRLSDAVENLEPLITHFERRALAQPQLIAEKVFDYCLLASGETVQINRPESAASAATHDWHLFDFSMDYAPSNQWLSLHKTLELCGLTVFGNEELSVKPKLLIDLERFEFRFELERRDNIDYLLVRRLSLESSEPRVKDLFRLLSRRVRYRETVPPIVLNAALRELQPHLRETVSIYPLSEFARQVKTCLARTVVAHHYIYFRLIKRLLEISGRTSGGQPFHAADLLSSCLVNYHCVNLDRARLLGVIRRFYPEFDFHPVLANSSLSQVEWLEKFARAAAVDDQTLGGERTDLRCELPDKTVVHLIAESNPPELQQYLDYINCEMRFINYRFDAAVNLNDGALTELAVRLAENAEELRGTWAKRATAVEADYQDFWRREVWSYGDNARSAISMTRFRYALYDPPYGGAGETLQSIIDDELMTTIFGDAAARPNFRIFALPTAASSYFINEWWDFLWVAVNPEIGKVIVILGTATD